MHFASTCDWGKWPIWLAKQVGAQIVNINRQALATWSFSRFHKCFGRCFLKLVGTEASLEALRVGYFFETCLLQTPLPTSQSSILCFRLFMYIYYVIDIHEAWLCVWIWVFYVLSSLSTTNGFLRLQVNRVFFASFALAAQIHLQKHVKLCNRVDL